MTIKMAELLIHIGYHKTASTWLQRRLFDNSKANFVRPWLIDEATRQLVDPHPFQFSVAAAREYFSAGIEQARTANRIPVLSAEELSGNPQSGGYSNRMVADRLAEVFPDARLLIIIREQRAMLQSVYQQYVRVGGAAAPSRYFFPSTIGPRIPGFRFENFEYHHLIQYYQKLFGRNRVCVLAMEMLQADPCDFVSRIVDFAGADDPGPLTPDKVYAAQGGFITALQRQTNRLFGRTRANPGAPFHSWCLARWYERLSRRVPAALNAPFDTRLARFIARHACGRYAESNRTTAQLTGLDLAQYGYELPSTVCSTHASSPPDAAPDHPKTVPPP